MTLVESPLDALAFRHSATVAGSAWAWLAVLFAALGLWRIRAVGSSHKPDVPHVPAPPDEAPPAGPTETCRSSNCHVEGREHGTPKGRFTAYFHVEDDGGGEEKEEEEGDGISDGEVERLERWDWEGMEVGRRVDLGWYRYQDTTALNGNIVRLWEGEGRLTAPSRKGLRRRI